MNNRLLLLLLLVIVAAALLGLAVADQAGYVLIAYGGLRFEATFWVFLALCALLAGLVYGARLLLRLLGASGRVVNPWSGRNRQRRVQQAVRRGVLALAAGDWSSALKLLSQAARHAPQPLLASLGAARAAHALGEHAQAEALLSEALERDPEAEVLVALEHARMLIERGCDSQARDALQRVREHHPRHPEALRLLPGVLERLQDWYALSALLPELRRAQTLPLARLEALEAHAWRAQLRAAAERCAPGDPAALQEAWQAFGQAQRQQPALLVAYVELLRGFGQSAEAQGEALLSAALQREYDPQLVPLYGRLQGQDLAAQLRRAEGWLKAHPGDAALLLALGRLSLRNRLWGKARDYFERSLQCERSAEACIELARLLEHLGDTARSQQVLQQGLGLLGRELPALPQPGPAR